MDGSSRSIDYLHTARSSYWSYNFLTMTDTDHTDSVEAYIKVTLDYAPKENGEEFDKWCEKYGFTPLDSGRRAWSSNYGTYFRDALGIACTVSGETFIFDQSDVDTFTTLQATQSQQVEEAVRKETKLLAQQMLVEMMKQYNRDADKYGASVYAPPTIEDALKALTPNHQD